MEHRPKLGAFTRPIDQRTSGSGHHLLEMLRHFIRINTDFDLHLIHYQSSDRDIYDLAREIIVPRNPVAAARALRSQGGYHTRS